MELTLEVRVILFAILAAFIVLALYYELRVLSGKRDERRDARASHEELYNFVATAEAIANALSNQGYAVVEAETLAMRAMMAFEARDPVKARSLATQARCMLSEARSHGPVRPVKDEEEEESEPFGPLESICDERESRPLPNDNSLPSHFLITQVRNALESWEGDRSEVQELLKQAEAAAADGDCDLALSLANKARCMVCDDILAL